MTPIRSRTIRWTAACLAVLALLLAVSRLEAAPLIGDDFNRPDGTSLGATPIGAYAWDERNTFGSAADVASIAGNELYLHGGAAVSGHAIAAVDQADLALSADLRFYHPTTPSTGATATKGLGLMARLSNNSAVYYYAANKGLVNVQMLPNGTFWVNEQRGGATSQVNLYYDNPFAPGTPVQQFQAPGTLPATINGVPFDANGDGILDANEPFRLGLVATGNFLQVQLNGRTILGFALSESTGVSANRISLIRNNFGGTGVDSTGYWDNLTGEIPPPLPAAFDTFTRANNTALGVAQVGGQAWHERTMAGLATAGPAISGNRLYMGTGNEQAILDVNFPHVVATADLTFQVTAGTGTAGQGGGFTLRKPSLGAGITNANSAGQVTVQILPSGAIWVSEQQGSSYVTLYGENPWSGAVGYPAVINFPTPGTLPQFINGLPFDLNQDGRLSGDEETFELGAVLAHHNLFVQINGETIVSFSNILGNGHPGENYFSVLRNNWAGTLATAVYYDNVAVDAWVPEPGTLALLGLGFAALPAAARLKRRRNRSKEAYHAAST